MRKIVVVGLGDIARKAYLPVLAARAGLDLHLMARDPGRLAQVAEQYRVPVGRRLSDLDAVLAVEPEAAFVHVATAAHAEVVGRLLAAGVPTYVDKPLADTIEGARDLVAQAEASHVPLMVGFNRRYVPAYQRVLAQPREVVLLQKNQNGGAGDIREIVYDDFIHVVDTLRYLVPGPARHTHVAGAVTGGVLTHVTLTLTGPGYTATGVLHRAAGAKQERLDVLGGGRTTQVVDLVQVTEHHDGQQRLLPQDGWAPVARQRGVEQVCSVFLDGVFGDGALPGLRDALATHELCERVVLELERLA
ncbi:virulence factor [Crossiella equi]|uniref:Virulence factor n=1 Tax=Crossiella equi TaxID=130796 RepID=A0ABS5A8B5_9PSEU|nr:Gfo/Idh/MocA family oxidoreductase [Crossiella equi]MBP2472826.1 virulence factor [Crossiella equi]